MIRQLVFGLTYVFRHRILNQRPPLIGGIVLLNDCNLHCRHCRIAERGGKKMSYHEACEKMDAFYHKGGRTLYFEGGEPMLWKDENYALDDLIRYARKTGFLASIIYTNGTLPLESQADTLFISLDGMSEFNNQIRGNSFDRVIRNIKDSTHKSLYINCTINQINKGNILEFCEFINTLPKIHGIFFYFHTPYYGIDELYIGLEERQEIMRMLLDSKPKYKILNSRAGLRSGIANNWERPLSSCYIFEQDATFQCCRFPGDPELCRNCGYLSYAEIGETLKLKPSALINALKYF